MKQLIIVATSLWLVNLAHAQIGLGITTPHPNAYFHINSTSKGVLLPRMTAVQRIAISPSPTANGLVVFDTDSSAYMYWTGTAWKKMGGNDENWIRNGNDIYNANTGHVGIGTSTPAASALLDMSSTARGVLLPRMNKTQRRNILSPATGLIVYQNGPDSVGIYYYDGAAWQWIEQNGKAWTLNGNAGTSPLTNMLGTTDPVDLAIGCNNIPRMFVTNEAEVGIGMSNPSYGLDVTTGNAAVNNCTYNGIRVKSMLGGLSNTCETGLLLGYLSSTLTDDEAIIRNFGLSGSGTKSLALGVGNFLTMMRLTSDGLAGIASGNMVPKYSLDINNGIGAVSPCGRNGIRLNTLQNIDNPCDNGLFMGYDNTSNGNAASFWNFSTDNISANRYLRFGFGTDFSESPVGESMRILPPGKGVGINQVNPKAMLHITNYAVGGVLSGVMITSPTINAGDNGFFSGLKTNGALTENDGYIWNYQNAPIIAGTNDEERMRIAADGNVGIGNSTPIAPLSFSSGLLNQKISFWNNDTDHVYGIGMQSGLLQIHSAFDVDDIAFGYGSSTNFTERMRVKGNGNVGIGNSDPAFLLDLNNRMRIRSGGDLSNSAGIWLNNSSNTALQSFIGNESDNTVGFYGSASGWSFTMNTNTGKIKIADGTQGAGKVLTSDANGEASWVTTNSNKLAVNATFPSFGVNLGSTFAAVYTNLFIDLPPGKWLVMGTYLLSQGGTPLTSGQSVFVRTSFSSSDVFNINTGDIIGSGLISGHLSYPTPFSILTGQNIINNTTTGTKRYYVWAEVEKTGSPDPAFFVNNFCGNFWSENNLVAIPMN
jgi:hypothetical protein